MAEQQVSTDEDDEIRQITPLEDKQSTKTDPKVIEWLLSRISQRFSQSAFLNKLIPIIIIGAGGIAQNAHIPTYIKNSLPIAAICDLDENQLKKCKQLLANYRHPSYTTPVQYFNNIQSLLSWIANHPELKRDKGVIFDVATRPFAYEPVLSSLPPKSIILLQKPFGHNLEAAKKLVNIITTKKFIFGVFYTLRNASIMLYIKNVLESVKTRKLFGDIVDVELSEKYVIPWANWPYLKAYGEHIELTFHSVHYLDALQSIFGIPDKVFAEIGNRPNQMQAILVYSDKHPKYPKLRIRVYIDHQCKYQKEEIILNVNGQKGSLCGSIGSMLGELKGQSNDIKDSLKVNCEGMKSGIDVRLEGSWFYDAFYGPMSNIQRYINGDDKYIRTDMKSCYDTSLLVHALILSDKEGRFIDMKDVHQQHGIGSFMKSRL